jgi:HSP20 family protein
MSISRYDPLHEALSLRRAMDQLFEQSFIRPRGMFGVLEEEAAIAPMDVCDTDQGYEVCMALPGVKPDDIEVTVQQNMLTVKGRVSSPVEEAERKNWTMREIPTGTFRRSVTFDRPVDVDNIRTRFENGILAISLPVSQAAAPKRISLSGGQSMPVEIEAKQEGKQETKQ